MPLPVFRNMGNASFQYLARRGVVYLLVNDTDLTAGQWQ